MRRARHRQRAGRSLEARLRPARRPTARRSPRAATERAAERQPAAGRVDPQKLDARRSASSRALYGKDATATVDPPSVMKTLQAILGPRDGWSSTVLRALWEPLKELRGGRGKSPAHEARWLQPRRLHAAARASAIRSTTGASRRPGACSTPAWSTTRTIRAARVVDPVAARLGRADAHAAGRDLQAHRAALSARRSPRRPSARRRARRRRPRCGAALASMERIPAKQKAELGEVLLGRHREEEARHREHALWALGAAGRARAALRPGRGRGAPSEGREVARAAARAGVEGRCATRWPQRSWRARRAIARAISTRRCGGGWPSALKTVADGERLARLVLEPMAREAREERLAFGDALPSGLRLVAESVGGE